MTADSILEAAYRQCVRESRIPWDKTDCEDKIFLVYNSSGRMIGSGYDSPCAAYKAASAASRRDTLNIYSVYIDFILDCKYIAGQKVGMKARGQSV